MVTLRYWAGMRAAAGVAEEQVDAATLAEALDVARARHGAGFGRSLSVCSLLVGDQPVGARAHEAVPLAVGDVVEVLPPFAGGSGSGSPGAGGPSVVADAAGQAGSGTIGG